MTKNGNLKRRVRARAAKTGESYAAALSHARKNGPPAREQQTGTRSLRLAVAQTSLLGDPGDIAGLRTSGAAMRGLMQEAKAGGARLVHFPEGAICSPNKRIMSAMGPRDIGPSDWSRANWSLLREELEAIRRLAGELRLWTVFGSVHRLTPPNRPHNSLYVVSDAGEPVTRYDERMLSSTKMKFMYAPGREPVTFDVDGLRFGCALGMETHYPELFTAYDGMDVDCVLFSTTGEQPEAAPAFAAEALGHAASHRFWVSYSAHAPQSVAAPSGIAGPDGRWIARCSDDGKASIAIAEITVDPADPARPWRRTARSDIYDALRIEGDERSENRATF